MISWLSVAVLLAATAIALQASLTTTLQAPILAAAATAAEPPQSTSTRTSTQTRREHPQVTNEPGFGFVGNSSSQIIGASSLVSAAALEQQQQQHPPASAKQVTTTTTTKADAKSSEAKPTQTQTDQPLSRTTPSGGNSSENETKSEAPAPKSGPGVVYTNQFVIQVEGGEGEARKLALKHGFVYLNHILGDYYHLEHRRLARRSVVDDQRLDEQELDTTIEDEPQVLQLKRQVLKKRVKRDFLEQPRNIQQAAGLLRPANQQPLRAASINQHQLIKPHNQSPPTRPANQQPARQNQRLQFEQPAVHPQHQWSTPSTSALDHLEPLDFSASSLQLQFNSGGHQLVAAPNPLFQQPKPTGAAANRQQQAINSNASVVYHSTVPAMAMAPSANIANGVQTPNVQFANASFSTNSTKQVPFNDPSWPLMWYLDGGARNGFDLNVMAAWKMGYTGKGIVITILDDGLEKDHPDLQANYDPLASFDINNDDADPMPRYDLNDSNRHGTRCAGEVAAVPDNNICSIGIAYNSKVGGVRMLDGEVTDAVEARSLGLNNQHIHIYSASWGPDDNGKTVDGPGELATRAFIEGVTNGRQGLGSIFIFASGNGGREHDNCNCDGYTNSIWTLSISSATENGYVPWYIEACSSTLATTYSSGSYEERQIATTDLHHSCTASHTGTSASAPLAAGICALVLESNPRLTWRDMQHIVVKTAKPANLVAKDWRTNALGRNVSHAFGYGLMDAAAMILMAKAWTTVPVQYTCEVRSPQMEKFISPKGHIELKLRAECSNVRFLEHVQSKVTISSSRRGDLHIYLVSPLGTRSTLLAQRPNDNTDSGFKNWPFMTVHSWGESPNGVWTLEVHNDGKPQNRAYLKEWTLILYGTHDDPNKHLDSSKMMTQSSSLTNQRVPPVNQPHPIPVPKRPSVEQVSSNHWTYSSPPPPLPPISGLRPQTTSVRPATTTTVASTTTAATPYVTTPTSTQMAPTNQPADVNNRLHTSGGESNKADFDVVLPVPALRPNQQSTMTASSTTRPFAANDTTMPTNSSSEEKDILVTQKPGVIPIDKVEAHMKPSVSQQDTTGGSEVDDNQIDGNAKGPTKDYRSSDDQSLYQAASTNSGQVKKHHPNQLDTSKPAAGGGHQERRQNSAASRRHLIDLRVLIMALVATLALI